MRFFRAQYIQMIKKAVESGVGAATDMGGMSGPLHPSWIASGIWEIFANDVLAVKELWNSGISYDKIFQIRVNKQLESNPLLPFVPLGIEDVVGGRTRIILPREGSTSYGWMESEFYTGYNFASRASASVIWKYGEGKTNAFESFLGHSWWSGIRNPTRNEFGQDILINYLLDVSGREYLENIRLVHEYRQSISDFHHQHSYIVDLFSFVGKFGANTNPLDRKLSSIREQLKESNELYLEGDVQGAIELSRNSISALEELGREAMRIRERALLWVYTVEWLVIVSALMITGFVLDQLMIRKRLFRKASITRTSR